ncbi:MAG: hypothetical protein A3D92_13645, partial [Bacteroidetes bacterium RIFCSPHIGHO2_02_FULL_44_7]
PSILFGQATDVTHYEVHLQVSDSNNVIHVQELITVQFSGESNQLVLNLDDSDGETGMFVTSVKQDGQSVPYKHKAEQLMIRPSQASKGKQSTFEIFFKGVPKDGLVIGQNKFGDRTFFGDNWPNRAHLWFACVDHPSDKATVRFEVKAPSQYTCVAVGQLEKQESAEGYTTTTYFSQHPLPTKVMVIGLAKLVSEKLEIADGVPVENFVYPQDRQAGFHDMKVAVQPLEFFSNYISAYPFEKLYNVESTTRFGGMENAGCIFYDEGAVKGEGTMENLIAHEIAHQWFGNSASESDWPHIWLSEGFATYFTSLYLEHTYGKKRMQEQLKLDRARVLLFAQKVKTPVLDTISNDLMNLLNPNSYQKGSWILHMLRTKIGDDNFQRGIQTYYLKFAYKNASTADFITCMNEASGQDLTSFFDQWLKRSGHPIFKIEKVKKGKYEMLRILQMQEIPFEFQLEIDMDYPSGKERVFVEGNQRETIVPITIGQKVTTWEVDPDVKLLFELYSQE